MNVEHVKTHLLDAPFIVGISKIFISEVSRLSLLFARMLKSHRTFVKLSDCKMILLLFNSIKKCADHFASAFAYATFKRNDWFLYIYILLWPARVRAQPIPVLETVKAAVTQL